MDTLTAYQWIFANWSTNTWQPIPVQIKQALNLHSAIGICSGMLITRTSAEGLNEFIHKVNKPKDGKK